MQLGTLRHNILTMSNARIIYTCIERTLNKILLHLCLRKNVFRLFIYKKIYLHFLNSQLFFFMKFNTKYYKYGTNIWYFEIKYFKSGTNILFLIIQAYKTNIDVKYIFVFSDEIQYKILKIRYCYMIFCV